MANIEVDDNGTAVKVVVNGVLDRTYLTPVVLGDRTGVYKYQNPNNPDNEDGLDAKILVTVHFDGNGIVSNGSVFRKV